MKFASKHIRVLLTLLFGVAVFCLWAGPFRSALNYHEEFQLFLMDSDYFMERMSSAGGPSVYLSEALVQFYNNFWLGALILAAELVAVQWIAWKILERTAARVGGKAAHALYALSFIPAVLLLIVLGDINVMHSIVVAAIIALLLLYVIIRVCRGVAMRVVAVFFSAVLFYWTSWTNHYRFQDAFLFFGNIYNARTYELLDYDRLVRANDWAGIIAKAERRQPDLPMSVSALNLALGMTNQLSARAMQFYQNGTEGLVPKFSREPFSTLSIAEMYFQMGLVNTAQRLYFEAMEGIPNYNKSCRCIRRLAETNLVNGQYEVARKYLRILRKTAFYAKWAERTLALVDSGEDAIDAHPLYGRLRKLRLEEDFLFSDTEVDKIFGKLFLHNTDNRLAMQYLLLYPQLEGDRTKYLQYLDVVRSSLKE